MTDPVWPHPSISVPAPRVPPLDLDHKEPRVPKQDVLDFLRAELTEERTDRLIQELGDQAKKILPDVPVEIAEKVLDFLLPDRVLDALDRVL